MSAEKPIEVNITGNLSEGMVMATHLAAALSALALPKGADDISPGDFLGVPRLFIREMSYQEHTDKITITAKLSDYSSATKAGESGFYKKIEVA